MKEGGVQETQGCKDQGDGDEESPENSSEADRSKLLRWGLGREVPGEMDRMCRWKSNLVRSVAARLGKPGRVTWKTTWNQF